MGKEFDAAWIRADVIALPGLHERKPEAPDTMEVHE